MGHFLKYVDKINDIVKLEVEYADLYIFLDMIRHTVEHLGEDVNTIAASIEDVTDRDTLAQLCKDWVDVEEQRRMAVRLESELTEALYRISVW